MIYEDERSVDELVDDILNPEEDEGVRAKETESAGDGQDKKRWDIPGEGTERTTCRRCGTIFLRPPKSRRTICPACFSASVSASMKASHAKRRERREHAVSLRDPAARRAGANSQQVKNGDKTEPEGAGAVENSEKTVAEAWAQLAEPTAARSAGPEEREPESHPREAREVLMDLYGTVRNLARAAGLDPSRTIEALWEVDSIFGNVGRA